MLHVRICAGGAGSNQRPYRDKMASSHDIQVDTTLD